MGLNSQQSNRGILKADAGRRKFTLTRYQPAPDVAHLNRSIMTALLMFTAYQEPLMSDCCKTEDSH